MKDTRRARLDNGPVAIARRNPASRSIAIHLMLEAGAAFDPAGSDGLASFTGMVLDRGADGLSARQIAEGFEDLGARFAVTTLRDTLEIECRCLPHHLPQILDRMRLLLASPTFPEEEVERARGLILTALAEREQNTAAVAEETLNGTLFPAGHPYHAPRLGRRDSVRAIRRDDLLRFHAARLRPQDAVIALVGDLSPDETIDVAARRLAAWKGGAAAGGRARIADPPRPDRPVRLRRAIPGKSQSDIALGFPGLRRDSPDLVPVMVFNCALGEFGLGGRLGEAVREREGLAYYAYSRFTAGLGPGPLLVRSGVAPDKVERAVTLILKTVDQAARRGFRPGEVQDAKTSLAASVPRQMETGADAATSLAHAEFYGLGIDFPERLPGLISAVTRRQVDEVAGRYLTPAHHVLVVAGPDGPKKGRA